MPHCILSTKKSVENNVMRVTNRFDFDDNNKACLWVAKVASYKLDESNQTSNLLVTFPGYKNENEQYWVPARCDETWYAFQPTALVLHDKYRHLLNEKNLNKCKNILEDAKNVDIMPDVRVVCCSHDNEHDIDMDGGNDADINIDDPSCETSVRKNNKTAMNNVMIGANGNGSNNHDKKCEKLIDYKRGKANKDNPLFSMSAKLAGSMNLSSFETNKNFKFPWIVGT